MPISTRKAALVEPDSLGERGAGALPNQHLELGRIAGEVVRCK